jgi:hypothetical protein
MLSISTLSRQPDRTADQFQIHGYSCGLFIFTAWILQQLAEDETEQLSMVGNQKTFCALY